MFMMLLVVLLPCLLAFLYEVTAVLFLIGFGELSWKATHRVDAIALRTAWLIVVLSLDIHGIGELFQDNDVSAKLFRWILWVPLSILVSMFFLYYTRVFLRGPAPIVLPNNQNDINQHQHQPSNPLTVLITGANTGIGKETAKQLAARGNTVILACRDVTKAQAALDEIQASLKKSEQEQGQEPLNKRLFILQLDLSSFSSVKQAADAFANMKLPNNQDNTLDVLINNAGVMSSHKQLSQDGLELCMQANHLGHFLFTQLLLPYLQQSSHPRILNLTSSTYQMATARGGTFLFDDPHCTKRPYTLFATYSQSKLANILFTQELVRRYPSILSLAIHPGLVRTDVTRNMSWVLQTLNSAFGMFVQAYQKTPTQGAYSSVWAATVANNNNITNGSLIVNSQPHPMDAYCLDPQALFQLWEWSHDLIQRTCPNLSNHDDNHDDNDNNQKSAAQPGRQI